MHENSDLDNTSFPKVRHCYVQLYCPRSPISARPFYSPPSKLPQSWAPPLNKLESQEYSKPLMRFYLCKIREILICDNAAAGFGSQDRITNDNQYMLWIYLNSTGFCMLSNQKFSKCEVFSAFPGLLSMTDHGGSPGITGMLMGRHIQSVSMFIIHPRYHRPAMLSTLAETLN